MAKKVFYAIALVLVILVIVFLGASIEVSNPLIWLLHIIGIGGVFVGGYILGRKTK